MSLLSAGAAGTAGLRSASVFGSWQFFTREINDVVLGHGRWFIRPQLVNCLRQHDREGKQRGFNNPGCEHPTIGNESGFSFSRQRLGRAFQSRPDGGEEFLPRRRPLDQKFEFCAHAELACCFTPSAISISSPIVVPVDFSVSPGNSNTEAVRMLTRATRHGFRFCSMWTTSLFGSR